MKTNYKLLSLSLSGLLMFSSCSNEELDNINANDGSMEISILATQGDFSAPEPQTRTQVDRWYAGDLDQTHTGSGVQMLWSAEETIGVFGISKYSWNWYRFIDNGILTKKEKGIVPNSIFSGNLNYDEIVGPDWLPSIHEYIANVQYAYYPFSSNVSVTKDDKSKPYKFTNITIPITISSNQQYASSSSIKDLDFKATNTVTGDDASGRTAKFQQLATLIRFVIDERDIKNKFGVKKFDRQKCSVVLESSTNYPITGDFSYNLMTLSDFAPTAQQTKNQLVFSWTELTEEIVQNKYYYTAYAVVAPIKSTSKKANNLNLKLQYDNMYIQFPTLKNKSLERGKVYNIGLNKESLKKLEVVKPAEPVKPSGKTNGNEFANGGNVI